MAFIKNKQGEVLKPVLAIHTEISPIFSPPPPEAGGEMIDDGAFSACFYILISFPNAVWECKSAKRCFAKIILIARASDDKIKKSYLF